MKLQQAFGIVRGDVVALVGAGGKTSTMVSLGYELAEMGWRVLATTTTRISKDQMSVIPRAISRHISSEAISQALNEDRFVFLYDSLSEYKVHGLDVEAIPQLLDSVDSDVMLIEADGARGRSLKAPYAHEPVIPADTSLVIPIASLGVLGQPLDEEHVYNVEAITNRYGFPLGSRIKSAWVAQVMRDETLGLSGIPSTARIVGLLNQADTRGYGRARARMIARLMLRSQRFHGVAIGAVRSSEPIFEVQRPLGAVILAAGMSRRMGQSKMLLPWEQQKTIIEHITEQVLNSRVDHVVVVTGHMAREVREAVEPLGAQVVYNRSYKTGEMLSSLKVGLNAMPDHIAAALVVLGDQPRIQPRVIYQIALAYAEGKSELIAPSFERRRGHPILIGRRYWPEFFNLPRGGVPREVINAHADDIHYVNVTTDSVLRDVDTPQDYSDERSRAGL